MPSADSYSTAVVTTLNTHRTPIQKQPESLLCLVGLSRSYFLGDDVYPTFLYDDDRDMDLFNFISAPNPTRVKTGTRLRVAHEVPLLTATASQNATTTEVVLEPGLEKEAAAMRPFVNKRRHERGNDEAESNALLKVLRKDHATFFHAQREISSSNRVRCGLHLLHVGYTRRSYYCEERERSRSAVLCQTATAPQARHCPETAIVISTGNVATTEVQGLFFAESLESGKSTSFLSMDGSPGGGYGFSTEAKIRTRGQITKESHNQDSQTRLEDPSEGGSKRDHMAIEAEVHGLHNQTKNLETLLETEVDMKNDAEAKNAKLAKELESLRVQFSNLQRCAEMDARLDKLSVDFDEELYPHMLTAIAGRRWDIGHGLRLAVMKCAKSLELRHAFTDVVSAGLVKGMGEGLKQGIEHGKDGRDLTAVEAYNPEADSKYVKALQDLKDLKSPLVDQLERLKDAPMELIMASLYIESDSEKYAPQWIRDLPPSSSQLKIPIYPEVCDPEDPWAFKEDMLLEDAITDNISRTEKEVQGGLSHPWDWFRSPARSDGIPVSVPTIALRGLEILLADFATQTEVADKEDEPHPRLQRSISLPPFYNLEWE
nr:transposase (putative), gypsy type [Tanacetum cinerariifolium]